MTKGRSPSCINGVELTENMESTVNDSDQSTILDHSMMKKKSQRLFRHDDCQRSLERDRKLACDKEFSLESRPSTDTSKQSHSEESCHQHGVRDKSLSEESGMMECDRIHADEILAKSARGEVPFPSVQPFQAITSPTVERSRMSWEKRKQHAHRTFPPTDKKGLRRERNDIHAQDAGKHLPRNLT